MGDGPINKGLEKIGLKDYPMPSPEPESAALLQIKPSQAKDKKGDMMEYYNVNGVVYDKYAFKVVYFSRQVLVVKQKIEKTNGKIQRYKGEVDKIERFVKAQEAAYRSKEIRVLEAGDIVKRLTEEYKEGLHTRFEEGDLEEISLKKAIATAKKNIPTLDAKSTIYRTQYRDIDNPSEGLQVFEDIRVLAKQYERKITEIEDAELNPLQDRLDANRFWQKKANENYQQYQKYLNSK
ncbi:hypothetical protein HZA40_01560 [Candidatus Peregrinibacteria bacterium]|nr:hypothetical protein [Candidatus Peregrinibacteria bacterium]